MMMDLKFEGSWNLKKYRLFYRTLTKTSSLYSGVFFGVLMFLFLGFENKEIFSNIGFGIFLLIVNLTLGVLGFGVGLPYSMLLITYKQYLKRCGGLVYTITFGETCVTMAYPAGSQIINYAELKRIIDKKKIIILSTSLNSGIPIFKNEAPPQILEIFSNLKNKSNKNHSKALDKD